MTRHTSLLLIVAIVAVAPACGASPPAEETKLPEKAQAGAKPAAETSRDVVVDAKRICARMDRRLAGLVRRDARPSPKQLQTIIRVWAVTVDELRGLTAPPARARRFRRMLAHFENAIRAARAAPGAEEEMSLVPIAVMASEGMKGGAIAHELGLDACSLFPPAPSEAEFERYVLEQAKKEGGLLGAPPASRITR